MKRSLQIILLVSSAALISACSGKETMENRPIPDPPIAKKSPKVTEIHGLKLVDDYFWMRDEKLPRDPNANPEVKAYLKAENDYADAFMAHTRDFQESLYKEMLARIKETDENVPYKDGGYYYYTRTVQGQQYPIYCRRKGSLEAGEEITLDMNEMSKGRKYFSVGLYDVADDENQLAFSTDTTGFRQYSLYFKDLSTGRISDKVADRVTSFAWADDNKTIFYTQEDPTTKRPSKLFRHRLGESNHDLIYEEKDELYALYTTRTRSKSYILAVSTSSTTSEVRYLPSARPSNSLKLFLPRKKDHEYYVDHIGEDFYIRTNDKGKNFRLVKAPVADPSASKWKELVPHRKDVMLEGIDCFASHYVLEERKNGIPQLGITDLKSGATHYIEQPEPVYVAFPMQNAEFTTSNLRFSYESLITPKSVYDYDVATRRRTLKKQQPVLGGYQPELYKSERLEATASDGTKIPVSIVYRKELKQDGSRPLLLEAYGSYGIPYDVDFDSTRLSLLDRGVIYAVAHIRGGGDLGKEWHDQGKMMVKKNTFTDFIASAEHLIREKYTSSDRIVITGGSAGGLLMGAVTNMRPDLFKAVVSYVPFVDVINTMLDETLPLTVGEFLEWGNPREKAAFDYMYSYSPYDNIERKNYPTILVRTSVNDSQVMYWEPAKYVAKLRAMKTDRNPLLFKVKIDPGGHGGSSGRYDRLKDQAFDYVFILEQFKISG
ncbi:MAG: S9 family peptidase [Acidobacteriota bacterium]|nr:MAG: S9 family peptidase [Acidobacteriota bacterium]